MYQVSEILWESMLKLPRRLCLTLQSAVIFSYIYGAGNYRLP